MTPVPVDESDGSLVDARHTSPHDRRRAAIAGAPGPWCQEVTRGNVTWAVQPIAGLEPFATAAADASPGARADRSVAQSSAALPEVLGYVRELGGEPRVCAWFKGPRRTRSRRALATWEPLVVVGGRQLDLSVVQDLEDALIATGRYRAFPGAMVGMKPPAFAVWTFRQLGARPGDALDDLYPGSGAVSLAWERYTAGGSDGRRPTENDHQADTSLADPRYASTDVEHDTSQRDPVDA